MLLVLFADHPVHARWVLQAEDHLPPSRSYRVT
jgi:hypothetical protein